MDETDVQTETLSDAIASTLQQARRARGWSVNLLADRSKVSRAMIGKIERGEAQPTAVLLGRLSGALGMSLSQLLARAEETGTRIARADEAAARWVDPDTGYRRRLVSPTSGGPIELIEIELPPRTEVTFPAESYAFIHQQVWVLSGRLAFREGATEHDLAAGDCLQLGAPRSCTFHNRTDEPCRYLVALARR